MDVTREQVIAYRVAAQQLDRSAAKLGDLAVLDLGVQDAAGEQARLAFDARLPDTPPVDAVGPG
ncbi:MAG: winged helix DNA-binding domain-containing protein, partial [Actinomycetota bacterium]|nr:winged helix DNA-binding domain-containing protein [Actinomycetota bacterium]